MAIEYLLDCAIMSRHCVLSILHHELDTMDRVKLGSSSVRNSDRITGNVDARITPPNVCRSLLWIQEARYGTTNSNKPNTPSDTRAIYLHAADARHNHGWHTSVRLHIYTAFLHLEQLVVKSNVLHVWLPVPRLYHTSYHLQRDHDIAMLFPSMCGRSCMVVEVVPYQRICSFLPIHILCSLLHIEDEHLRICINAIVFRLYLDHGIPILLTYRHRWILCLLLVCPSYLLKCQGGLDDNPKQQYQKHSKVPLSKNIATATQQVGDR